MKPFSITINGVIISKYISQSDLDSIDEITKEDLDNGFVWFRFPEKVINNERVIISLCFNHEALERISIYLFDDDSLQFSEKVERQILENNHNWLLGLGYTEGLYPWGEIWNTYDSKGGFSEIGIQYK